MTADRPPSDATLAEALALGGTRVGSLAHPDCLCGRRKPPMPPVPPLTDDEGCYIGDQSAIREWMTLRRAYGSGVYTRRDCPVHSGTKGDA